MITFEQKQSHITVKNSTQKKKILEIRRIRHPRDSCNGSTFRKGLSTWEKVRRLVKND